MSLGVPRRSVTLVAGAGARDKVIEVQGLTVDEAERLLAAGSERGPT